MMFHRFAGLRHAHFVGIGGAGMSGIAEVLAQYEVEVSGCDLAGGETVARLERLGIAVALGHSAAHLEGVDLVVVSSAIAQDNPEVVAARARGITVVRRAEMLAELMRLKYGVAVAGTHGKTTTTSLVGAILTEAGLDPTVIVGGRLRVSGTGARLGRSDYMVVEADEFDRSFLSLAPILAVITSVDRDHLDTYRDLDEIRDAFVVFASRVPFFGQVIACADDANVRELLPRLADRRVVTYGLDEGRDLAALGLESTPAGSRFRLQQRGAGELGVIEIPLPGLHNVRNALAAIGVGLALGIPVPVIARALAGFAGVHRRFERLGSWHGADVVDDYAHHPTEVAATLAAARQVFPRRQLHAVFQPHLFSRTRDLAEEFGRALLGADRVVVTDVYPSREQPIEGVTGELVARAARAQGHGRVDYCADWHAAAALLEDVAGGDVVITLGAGDIYRLAERLVAEGKR
ncbi:MAG: UDP-N-acetylmuramate--L-alanine ligase [Thermoanaerobaculia bacterium]|nr:MAG: UDP-N-acetylmuramate--L-alanine ligase [Thermoanaerobaculia bacterium]